MDSGFHVSGDFWFGRRPKETWEVQEAGTAPAYLPSYDVLLLLRPKSLSSHTFQVEVTLHYLKGQDSRCADKRLPPPGSLPHSS